MLKNIIQQQAIIAAGVMSGTNVLTSTPMSLRHIDNIALQAQWTGTPTGTFAIQVSNDYQPPRTPGSTVPANAGTWFTITPGLTNPAGAAASDRKTFADLPDAWIRLVYTNASGAGTLNAYLNGKSKGL